MGADNQAQKVLDRMQREEMIVAAAVRLIRELEKNSSISEPALEAMLGLKRALVVCGWNERKESAT